VFIAREESLAAASKSLSVALLPAIGCVCASSSAKALSADCPEEPAWQVARWGP
jgi:hypothetical protein